MNTAATTLPTTADVDAAAARIKGVAIRASLADPRPDVPAKQVFARLREHHRDQAKSKKRRDVA